MTEKRLPSPALPAGFVLVDSPAEFCDAAALVVRVPAGIRSKQKLLTILAAKLRLPSYFGWNWDALEECLRDLSWLPAGQAVVIVHEGLLFGPSGENRGIYLSVLRSAAAHWQSQHDRKLSVLFASAVARDLLQQAGEPTSHEDHNPRLP